MCKVLLQIGEAVTYKDINLFWYRGILKTIGRTPKGGDCTVEWYYPLQVISEECLFNIQPVIR